MKAPASPGQKRVAIYTRKSTTDGLEQAFNSLDAQRDACAAYAKSQPGWIIVGTYADGGRSGATLDRPEFQRMMASVDAGAVDVIITYKLDRLSRSVADLLQLVRHLDERGVAFASVTQNISTAGAMGRFFITLMGAIAELERAQTIERTRDKIAGAKRRGRFVGGPVPLGYDLVDGKLVVNTFEAVAVRAVFEIYVGIGSLRETARELNKRGYQSKARSNGARSFTMDMVERTVRNVGYIGKTTHDGELFKAEHDAIVDAAVFERANRLLAAHAQDARTPGATYVLSGLLRCGICGGALTGAVTKKAKREYHYYRCVTRDKDRDRCSARAIPAEGLEHFVASEIARAATSPAFARRVGAEVRARADVERRDLERERCDLQRACEAMPRGASERSDLHAACARRLAAIDARLAALGGAEGAVVWQRQVLEGFEALWGSMTAENRRHLVTALIEEIVVDTRGSTITLRFADPAARKPEAAE